jgi:hypothetical protein
MPVDWSTKRRPLAWRLLIVVAAMGCATAAKPVPQPATSDESSVMADLRAKAKANPAVALSLADDSDRRFGESISAEERRALAIQALIDLGHIGEARSRAYRFLERYPNGPYSAHVAAMTGVHVTPTGPGQRP